MLFDEGRPRTRYAHATLTVQVAARDIQSVPKRVAVDCNNTTVVRVCSFFVAVQCNINGIRWCLSICCCVSFANRKTIARTPPPPPRTTNNYYKRSVVVVLRRRAASMIPFARTGLQTDTLNTLCIVVAKSIVFDNGRRLLAV